MKIRFLGATQEVGRSAFLIKEGNTTLLLDAGIMLGRPMGFPNITDKLFKEIDAVVISHAHLDHTGYLPFLINRGYKGKIYATKATKDFTHVLLSDLLKINPDIGFERKDITKTIQQITQVDYNEKIDVGDFEIEFYNAGHILGSASIYLTSKINNDTLLYTGDINTRTTYLLDGAETPEKPVNYLITESTYGGYEDKIPSRKQAIKMLCDIINHTYERGGYILIPSFAVGRSQEMLLILENNMRSGRIPKMPIYIDGMIKKANKIHRQNVISGKKEIQMRILMSDDDPFKFSEFINIDAKNRSTVYQKPGIILTTSGMLTGGPIFSYLKSLGKNKNNSLVLVGFQVEGTPGRRLIDGEKTIEIDGKDVKIDVEVHHILFSAHSDRADLLQYVSNLKSLKKIFIVHGEKQKQIEFAQGLQKYDVSIPILDEEIEI